MTLALEKKAIASAISKLKPRTEAFIDGKFVKAASGKTFATENPGNGKTIAKIVPQTSTPEVPYFARRKLSPEFRRIMHRLRGGTDSTQIISEDRDAR